MAELTPMMRQYLEMKEQNPGCLLFFRLGDFYEMFAEDAKLASKELDLTLTTRDRKKSEEDQTPMCGVPYHSAEAYIARLVSRGYKVAICEQMEDPALAKGLVKREITRIVTPGTLTESAMLDEHRNNYFACIYGEGEQYGVCFCDISTGQFHGAVVTGADAVLDQLGCFQPAEVLQGGAAAQDAVLQDGLRFKVPSCVENGTPEDFALAKATETVKKQFGAVPEELAQEALLIQAAGALLEQLHRNQKTELPHVRKLEYYQTNKFLELDLAARRNLELAETLRSKEKKGTLLWVMDKTKTAMGSRMLRSWMERPLLSPNRINKRLEAVEELVEDTVGREELIYCLREVTDLERVMARIVTGSCNCRDFRQLSNGLTQLPEIKAALRRRRASLWQVVAEQLDELQDLKNAIDERIVEDPPFTVREGGMIRSGFHEELDRLHDILSGGKGTLAKIEAQEKEKTGIKNLRVGYNRVFGYYIEVAKGQVSMVPDSYIRRQTLANGERYITEELKELENTILTAKDRCTAIEYDLFAELREFLAAQHQRVQDTAHALAAADVLSCFAAIAVQNNYCRPRMEMSGILEIEAGRHPVVEQVLKESMFVPNDTDLSMTNRIAIITGPNMAGKSTYMRQVALIVLMAQMGSFVPAKSARIGVVDRLFTRIGASDDLAAGQSTFMVEMQEVADILRHATSRSLLILDEIGRGTSTYDGMAIARAVLEYVADSRLLGAKTLFATHYHELSAIDQELPGVKNYNISVKKRGSEMIFLRKIVPGAADRSYGVEVARLAGLPDRLVTRARTILRELEAGGSQPSVQTTREQENQIMLTDPRNDDIRARLEKISVETMTPIEAMNLLYELKQMTK